MTWAGRVGATTFVAVTVVAAGCTGRPADREPPTPEVPARGP